MEEISFKDSLLTEMEDSCLGFTNQDAEFT